MGSPKTTTARRHAPVEEAPALDERRVQLAELIRECGDEVLRVCHYMLDDRDAARDLRQDIFVEAFEKLHQYRAEGPLRAWLFAMVRHRCLDATKIRKRFWKRFWIGSPKHEPPAPQPPADDQLGEDGLLRALVECLRALPAHLRMSVLLRYDRGMTYQEIARLGQERPTAVHNRVSRALPLLRSCVEAKGVSL